MGTYTYYELKSSDGISNIPTSVSSYYDIDRLFKYRSVESKWYEHRNDLVKVSLANPTSLIIVECRSEDDEYWKLYLLNGILREVVGQVVFPEVDLAELYQISQREM